MTREVTRRTFLAFAGVAAAAAALPSCGGGGAGGSDTIAFRRSVRHRRASIASKKNCANKVFRTRVSALLGGAHPGEHAKIVSITLSPEAHAALFANGDVADLRHA